MFSDEELDYKKSLLTHRCKRCGAKIRSRVRHVVCEETWGINMVHISRTHFCDPHCAKGYFDKREREKKKAQKDKEILNSIVFGGR